MNGRVRSGQLQEFVDDLLAIGIHELTQAMNVAEASARASMVVIVDELLLKYAKRQIYVPGERGDRIIERQDAIYRAWSAPQQGPEGSRAFSMDRVIELSIANRVTERSIYLSIEAVRRRGGPRTQAPKGAAVSSTPGPDSVDLETAAG